MAERSNDLGRETGLDVPCVSPAEFCATALSVPRNTTANSFFQDIDHPSFGWSVKENLKVYASSAAVGNPPPSGDTGNTMPITKYEGRTFKQQTLSWKNAGSSTVYCESA